MGSQLINSLIAGIAVGAASGYLGSLMVSRRMALVGDALGHVALPGMGLALLAGIDPSLGAFGFLMIGIFIIWRFSEVTLLSVETLVGIVFVTSLAFGFTIVPEHELHESLVGDISAITTQGMIFSVLISSAVVLIVSRIYKGMVLLNLSPDLARVEGIPTRKYNFVFLFAIVLIVSIGVKVTGSLLVGALVIIPAATARIVSVHLRQYTLLSSLFGVLSCVFGILLTTQSKLASGPAIILIGSFVFFLAFGFRTFFHKSTAGIGKKLRP